MTFTRLIIGEPRLKGTPRGDEPCVNNIVEGINLAQDIDAYQALFGTTIPFANELTSTNYPTAPAPGYVQGNPTNSWAVSSANPHSGTYHIRGVVGGGAVIPTTSLIPVRTHRCGRDVDGTTWFASANVQAGQLFTFGFWCMRSAADGDATVAPIIDFYADDFTLIESQQPGTGGALGAVPTTYTEFSFEYVVPSGADYVQATFRHDATSGGAGLSYDVDDFTVQVV